MDTTFATYTYLTRNMTQTLKVTQSEPANKRDTQYFQDNIGNVKSVDDLMGNTRLYNYMVKSYGLEEMGYAKAYMRKVLEDKDFLSRTNDDRFKALAAGFDVLVNRNTTSETEADYFKDNIGNVKSANELVNNSRLYNYAIKAFGLEDVGGDRVYMQEILEDSSLAASTRDDRLKAFSAAFDFATNAPVDPETQYFEDKIGDVKSASDLINDTRLYNYAIKAFDLGDAGDDKAYMKLLLENSSIVDSLKDDKLKAFTSAFHFDDFSSSDLETQYFEHNISDVKSADDLLNSPRLYNYVIRAFGLDEMGGDKAYIKKALEDYSFAIGTRDDRIEKLAEAFNFRAYGEFTTSLSDTVDAAVNGYQTRSTLDAVVGKYETQSTIEDVVGEYQYRSTLQTVVDNYANQSLEEDQGTQNEGVRLALYFKRAAPGSATAYGLLGDPALWEVVKTIFSLPDEMANADIERQAATVNKLLNVDDLKDPEKLDRLVQRFTLMYDLKNSSGSSNPVMMLFSGSTGLDASMSILNLPYGG